MPTSTKISISLLLACVGTFGQNAAFFGSNTTTASPLGPITYINSCGSNTYVSGVVSCTMTTTGANYIQGACFSSPASWGSLPVLTDSLLNVYIPLPIVGDYGNNVVATLPFFSQGATGGVSQIFTCTSNSGDPVSINAIAFSGVNPSASDQNSPTSNSTYGSITTSIQPPGSLTASGNGYLYIVPMAISTIGGAGTNPSLSIDSGFTIATSVAAQNSPYHTGGATAYLIQPTAAPVRPTWTLSVLADVTTMMSTFKH